MKLEEATMVMLNFEFKTKDGRFARELFFQVNNCLKKTRLQKPYTLL
jgi:hypothetical protein